MSDDEYSEPTLYSNLTYAKMAKIKEPITPTTASFFNAFCSTPRGRAIAKSIMGSNNPRFRVLRSEEIISLLSKALPFLVRSRFYSPPFLL